MHCTIVLSTQNIKLEKTASNGGPCMPSMKGKSICHPSSQVLKLEIIEERLIMLYVQKLYACRRWSIDCSSVPFIRGEHYVPNLTGDSQ